jgi:hypothetical protein
MIGQKIGVFCEIAVLQIVVRPASRERDQNGGGREKHESALGWPGEKFDRGRA